MTKKLQVMLVDESRTHAFRLEQALTDAGYEVVAHVEISEHLYMQVESCMPDVIVVDIKAPDKEDLLNLEAVSNSFPRPIAMFTNKRGTVTIEKAISAGISAYVVDGLGPERLSPIIKVAIARFRELHALRQELEDTRKQLTDRKLIEQAKGLIMKKAGMDEDKAYKALRKMAMDGNIKLSEVAKNVLSVSEILM